jgi:hypothetical protein
MLIAPRADINILDSNVDEEEAGVTVWASDTSYSLNDTVQVTATHRKYKATQDVPENIYPPDDVNPTTGIGTYWYDYEAVNYYKAFDELGSSVCQNTDSIYYKFTTSDVDLLMLENLTASEVRVIVTNTATGIVIQDVTTDLTTRDVYDWFEWTYEPFEYQNSFALLLQMAFESTLEIYINNVGSVAKVGHIAFGRSVNAGISLANPAPIVTRRGLTTKTRDEFGNIVTRKGARYKRMTINCIIKSIAIDTIEQRLERMADKPLIFLGDESEGGFRSLLIFGELKDHDMPIASCGTKYQLEVEGYL